MERRRSQLCLLIFHPTLYMVHLHWLELRYSCMAATAHHKLSESSSMWAISPGYDYSNLSIYKTNPFKVSLYLFIYNLIVLYIELLPDSSQLFYLSTLIKLLSLWYQPSHHVVMMEEPWCVIILYDGIQNWKKGIMNVDICLCMWEGIPIQGHERPCMLYAVYLHLIIFRHLLIYHISSPSKLIISPYQNLWLRVFELCCITFLRMRSSTEIPRKILVNQFCVTDVSHSSPHVFFLHLFLKSSSLPNDIWVEWIVSLGWDIVFYDNLSHV